MNLFRTLIGWKLLDGISEAETPAEFVRFYGAIKSAAVNEHFLYSATEQPVEHKIRVRMVEALGRSLQPNPATLPSITNEIRIQGERWHVILSATAIPYFSVAVVESGANAEQGNEYRAGLAKCLAERGDVGYCVIDGNRLHGKTWHLYLHCKIRILKTLRTFFSLRPFRMSPVLQPPDTVFRQLAASMPEKTTLVDDPAAVSAFLDKCDRVLVTHLGAKELNQYLVNCSISSSVFLRAQHSIRFKVGALF